MGLEYFVSGKDDHDQPERRAIEVPEQYHAEIDETRDPDGEVPRALALRLCGEAFAVSARGSSPDFEKFIGHAPERDSEISFASRAGSCEPIRTLSPSRNSSSTPRLPLAM